MVPRLSVRQRFSSCKGGFDSFRDRQQVQYVMVYYVYLIKTLDGFLDKSYVGYTNNIEKRLNKHNSNLGARSTRGYKWEIIYKKRFYSKTKLFRLNTN